jgi:hypothetical protein
VIKSGISCEIPKVNDSTPCWSYHHHQRPWSDVYFNWQDIMHHKFGVIFCVVYFTIVSVFHNIQCWMKHNRSLMVAVQGPDCGPPLIHTVLNDNMVGEWWIWEELEGSGCGIIKIILTFAWRQSVNHRQSYPGWCLGWDSNQASPEYKSRELLFYHHAQ